MADEEEGFGMNIPDLPDSLIAKYHRRLTRDDLQKYQEFGELMNQVDASLPDEEKSKLVRQLTNKISGADRKSTRLNSSHSQQSRMPSSA